MHESRRLRESSLLVLSLMVLCTKDERVLTRRVFVYTKVEQPIGVSEYVGGPSSSFCGVSHDQLPFFLVRGSIDMVEQGCLTVFQNMCKCVDFRFFPLRLEW
jgi:hypothetical protein